MSAERTPHSEQFETIRLCLRNPVIPNIYDAEARAALDSLEEQHAKLRRAVEEHLDLCSRSAGVQQPLREALDG